VALIKVRPRDPLLKQKFLLTLTQKTKNKKKPKKEKKKTLKENHESPNPPSLILNHRKEKFR